MNIWNNVLCSSCKYIRVPHLIKMKRKMQRWEKKKTVDAPKHQNKLCIHSDLVYLLFWWCTLTAGNNSTFIFAEVFFFLFLCLCPASRVFREVEKINLLKIYVQIRNAFRIWMYFNFLTLRISRDDIAIWIENSIFFINES